MISDRVFLAFETDRGLAYAQASGWQRTYLLWTFRNFRGVPHKILNDRQRELVETLFSGASVKLNAGVDESTVIGTVEGFSPSIPGLPTASAITEQLVPSVVAQWIAISTRNGAAMSQAFRARLDFSGVARTAGAAVLVASMAFLSWQQLRDHQVVSASTPVAVAIPKQAPVRELPVSNQLQNAGPAIVTARAHQDSQPLPVLQMASAAPLSTVHSMTALLPTKSTPVLPAAQSAKTPEDSNSFSKRRADSTRAASSRPLIADLGTAHDVSAAPPRMQISGPPRKIVYPDCPESRRGKVSLQAVVASDGVVSQVKALSGDRLLAAAATRAIRQWRYQPASAGVANSERETRITVAFIADDVVAISFPDAAAVSP